MKFTSILATITAVYAGVCFDIVEESEHVNISIHEDTTQLVDLNYNRNGVNTIAKFAALDTLTLLPAGETSKLVTLDLKQLDNKGKYSVTISVAGGPKRSKITRVNEEQLLGCL